MNFASYTVYALPDTIVFGEPTSGTPVCDNGDACVIGLFSNQNDFSKPHLFTAPFYVAPNADDGGENPGDGSPLAATPVSPTNSTVVASPPTATADGVDSSKVTVTLEDTMGFRWRAASRSPSPKARANRSITVAGVATDTATTDATTGIGQLHGHRHEDGARHLYGHRHHRRVTLTGTATVTFAAPVVTPSNSSVVGVAEHGGERWLDHDHGHFGRTRRWRRNPWRERWWSLSDGTGHSTITAVSATTNTSGQATFTATDTTDEIVTFTATDTTDSIALTGKSASVTFGTVTVSASASTVSASPTVVSSVASAGVLPTGTVTVTLLAADGTSPVSGKDRDVVGVVHHCPDHLGNLARRHRRRADRRRSPSPTVRRRR